MWRELASKTLALDRKRPPTAATAAPQKPRRASPNPFRLFQCLHSVCALHRPYDYNYTHTHTLHNMAAGGSGGGRSNYRARHFVRRFNAHIYMFAICVRLTAETQTLFKGCFNCRLRASACITIVDVCVCVCGKVQFSFWVLLFCERARITRKRRKTKYDYPRRRHSTIRSADAVAAAAFCTFGGGNARKISTITQNATGKKRMKEL